MITPEEMQVAWRDYLGEGRVDEMQLVPGKFYVARSGDIWCCFNVDRKKQEQAQADCVRVTDSRVEYFFLDGRYDRGGKREHTLVKEITYP